MGHNGIRKFKLVSSRGSEPWVEDIPAVARKTSSRKLPHPFRFDTTHSFSSIRKIGKFSFVFASLPEALKLQFAGLSLDDIERNQRTLADSGAALADLIPGLRTAQVPIPERPSATLGGAHGIDCAASRGRIKKRAIAVGELGERSTSSDQPSVKNSDFADRLLPELGDLGKLGFGDPNKPGRAGAAISTAGAVKLQPVFVPRFVRHARQFMEPSAVSQSVGGIVLCGGRSSRMGRPKLTLPIGGEPMLVRVVRILRATVGPVVVVAAPGQEVPLLPSDVRILHDDQEHLGPLAGMAVGLRALAGEVEAAFVSACDVPLLNSAFISEVIRRLGSHELAVPKEGDFFHPLAGVYRTSLAERASQLVAAQRMRPLFLIQASDSVEIPVGELRGADPELQSLLNLNRPEDYEAALQFAELVDHREASGDFASDAK